MMYRLMSGLRSVADERVWRPTGVPTAAKLIKALDASDEDELDLVLYPGDPGDQPRSSGVIDVEGLSTPVTILEYGPLIRRLPYRLRLFLAPFWRAAWSLRRVFETPTDIYYTDRGNVIAAGAVSRLSRVKTVLRVLGIPPPMWGILEGKKPMQFITRFAFRSPFALVIGTNDGSRISAFFRKTLSGKVPWLLKINGVKASDMSRPGVSVPLKIVFLGRLVPFKGIEEIVDAISGLPEATLKRIQLTVIGQGSLENSIRTTVADSGLQEQIKFTGAIEHHEVSRHLADNDIYVSLNQQGQIINSNLEALAAGLCLIFAKTDDQSNSDRDSKSIFGEDAAIWIDRSDLKNNLQKTIVKLLNNPEEVARRKSVSQELVSSLDSWEERMSWEIDLLKSLAGNRFRCAEWNAQLNDQP